MMQRDVPSYSEELVYREVAIDELKELREEVLRRFGADMHCSGLKAVEPQVLEQQFGATWSQFEAILGRHRADLRRYEFYFYPGKASDAAPITRVQFGLRVILRSKFGDRDEAERKIVLTGLGCYQHDFEAFVDVTSRVLGLEKPLPAPPVGMDWEDVTIRDRVRSITDPELSRAIEGSLAAIRYEEAMQNAVILVESKLRTKCLWAGKQDAQAMTGYNLAIAAYHPDTGCLQPPWPVATNASQGAMHLFMGFVQYLRNAFGHNSVVMAGDKECVFELLAFCEFLLRVIDKSGRRWSNWDSCD